MADQTYSAVPGVTGYDPDMTALFHLIINAKCWNYNDINA